MQIKIQDDPPTNINSPIRVVYRGERRSCFITQRLRCAGARPSTNAEPSLSVPRP
jgi:hypothetical protein